MDQLLDSPVDAKKQLKSLIKKGSKIPTLRCEKMEVEGYEQIWKVSDSASGLKAIIAIHNTSLGPALGGIRIYPYANEKAALEDVLRLSKGMTYKAAVSQVGFGGGKSVIIADPKKGKTPELLMAFGAAVQSLGGLYICAEDVGCTTEDVKVIRKATKYVVGLPSEKSSGDPGPFTAWGTFRGIQSTMKKIYGSDSLEGKKVALQGLGNVGGYLAEFLFWHGAKLILSDVDEAKLEKFCKKFGAERVLPDEIHRVECDVFAPCAMGGIVNGKSILQMRCKAVAGSANNQLMSDHDAELLMRRGILYAPDFVINAGGLLNVAAELEEEGYRPAGPRAKVDQIYDTLLAIYEIAEKNRESTQQAALSLAEYRLKYGVGRRTDLPTFHHVAE